MIDIAIISVPGIVEQTPQAAPALLKASLVAAGFSCRTFDYNIRLYKDSKQYIDLENYFCLGLNTEFAKQARQLVANWVKEIIESNPTYIGISVFTYQSRVATQIFCEEIRKISNCKIILGGQGLADGSIEGAMSFADNLQKQGLIDHWIRSEGEVSLIELLKGNTDYSGINSVSFTQLDDLTTLPFPNFDDYDFTLYDSPSIPITTSRGCVRSCSFCDIHEHWKYRFKPGQYIADEIMYLNQRYNINSFAFTDSLVNGNLKEFNKFIKILGDYNKTANNPIFWSGQFIVRSPKEVNEQYWHNIKRSGGGNLLIGVETGSEVVRQHMNKKFTNSDLDYTTTMLDRYNITCTFLMIVGYPTETEKDFQDTLDMFTKYKSYANKIIQDVNIGATLGILPGTPLYDNAEHFGIELDKFENNWVATKNPELTIERRIARRHELKNHLEKLGYVLRRDSAAHMLEILENNLDIFDKRLRIKKLIKIKHAK